jgi:hypothetical protein
MSSPQGPLPPQARSRSLDDLDAEIGRAEVACTRWAMRVRDLEAAGLNSSYVRGLLGIADDRLAQLNRSRGVLLRGEESGEPEAAS